MSTQPITTNVLVIPLTAIVPNPNNPRKHFDKKALEDLADSIKAHGVRQPALVRPNGAPGKYEIVCGERRWRASKLAGKDTLLAIVDPSITDQAAIEIGILENLQREDVHPLDEALGYKLLIEQLADPKQKKTTPETIAAKVGKSSSYVYQRLKLAELSKQGQEDFRAGFITAAHATDIARLQPEDQARALEFCHKEEYGGKRSAAPPFRELRQWIQENVQLNLDKAPFDITDAKLIKSAGACTDCPKRSGSNPMLFEGIGKNTCMDPTCYQAKKMALVHVNVGELETKHGEKPILISHEYSPDRGKCQKGVLYEEQYREKFYKAGKEHKIAAGSCPDARLAVYIDAERYGPGQGKGAGSSIYICTNKQKCKVHADVYASRSGGDETAIRRKQRIYRHYTSAVFKAIADTMKKPTREDLEMIAREFFRKLGHYQEKPMIEILDWPKKITEYGGAKERERHFAGMTDAQLQASFVLMAIASDLVTPGSYSMAGFTPHLLEAVAKRHGIKIDPLKAAAREKFTKKAKAKKGKKAA